jgi:starch-binding outer membrane protein, SusD/RagB family
MVKTVKYILILVFLLGVLSCTEEWFTKDIDGGSSLDEQFVTEEHAVSAVTSCYDPVKGRGLFGNFFQVIFHAADDRAVFEKPVQEHMSYNSSHDQIDQMYKYLFRGVYRCNVALEKIPPIKMDESLKYRLLGEVKFLRGLYYSYQTLIFNQPPLITRVITETNKTFANTPKNEFYDQIEKDLLYAISALPDTYDEANLGRATKGAALALLGKSYLYRQEWSLAKKMFMELENSGIYSLSVPLAEDSADFVNAYLCNFTEMNLEAGNNMYLAENNRESVFEIQFNDDKGWNYYIPGFGSQGSLVSAYFAPHGWHNIAPTSEFAAQFEQAPEDHPGNLLYDPRKYATLFMQGDTLEYRTGNQYYHKTFNPVLHANPLIEEGFGVRKYVFPFHYFSEDLNLPLNDPNNWRLIRYADVLLMLAEAEYHINGSSELANECINKVRSRVGMPPVDEVTPGVIIHERDVELGLEAVRFHDLVRWSRKNPPWARPDSLIDGFQKGKHEYLPIPQSEILKMNGKLAQNPGW